MGQDMHDSGKPVGGLGRHSRGPGGPSCGQVRHSVPPFVSSRAHHLRRNTLEVDIEEIYPALAPAVLSHSRALRLGALRLLAATRPSDAREVVKRCLAGEEVPLEVSGVRERVLRIGRVETVVKDKQTEADVGPDLCGRWLVGARFVTSSGPGARLTVV
jgi:hypothetical protein